MWYVNLGVFGAKESVSVLKIKTLLMYCTVQKKYSFHKTVQYRHVIYRFHVFLGQRTYFWTYIMSMLMYCTLPYSTVQFCAVMYSKIHFLLKLFNTGMIYVISIVFWAKKLISELKMTLMFMYCTVPVSYTHLTLPTTPYV